MSGEIDLPEIVDSTIAAAFENQRQSARHCESVFGQRGDSPIEWAMSVAFQYAECLGMGGNELKQPKDDWSVYFNDANFQGTVIIPQAKVKNYRADFMIVTGGNGVNVAVAIECDGHDFHERTKEQARHDRSRDRFFVEQGIIVLRFTGAEIYANANDCAEQALTAARSIWFDRYSLRGTKPE
jgi:very-short-patch-repair endonuclease